MTRNVNLDTEVTDVFEEAAHIARINMKKCPLFVDVLSICRKYMIARILNLLQLVAELSARWQHLIVSHYLHGFKN